MSFRIGTACCLVLPIPSRSWCILVLDAFLARRFFDSLNSPTLSRTPSFPQEILMFSITHLAQRALLAADTDADAAAGASDMINQALGRSPIDLAILVGVVLLCIIAGMILSVPFGAAAVCHVQIETYQHLSCAVCWVWIRRIGALLGFVGLETVNCHGTFNRWFFRLWRGCWFAFKDTLSNLAAGVLLMFYARLTKANLLKLAAKLALSKMYRLSPPRS